MAHGVLRTSHTIGQLGKASAARRSRRSCFSDLGALGLCFDTGFRPWYLSKRASKSSPVKMAVNAKYMTPLPSITTRCRQCLLTRFQSSRHFSSTPSERVMQELHASKDSIQRQLENKKSRRVEMKGMSGSRIPDDIGIIPQTFVRPPNSEMPRLFGGTWKTRLKLEWLWARSRVENFGS